MKTQIHVSRISSEVLDEIFSRAKNQGEYILALYRHVIPIFDKIDKVEDYPVCSRETWLDIARRAQLFDTRHHPNVIPGGMWMNSGFSTLLFPSEGFPVARVPRNVVLWKVQPVSMESLPLSTDEVLLLGAIEQKITSVWEGYHNDLAMDGSGEGLVKYPDDEKITECIWRLCLKYGASPEESYDSFVIRYVTRLHRNISFRTMRRKYGHVLEWFGNVRPRFGETWNSIGYQHNQKMFDGIESCESIRR